MNDGSLISSLERALAAAPNDLPLRRHLAQLLISSGRAADALQHCTTILASVPDDFETLKLAAAAARRMGDAARGEAYERLARVLERDGSGSGEAPEAKESLSDTGGSVVRLRLVGEDEQASHGRLQQPVVTLADVAGMDAVKRRLDVAFLAPMRNPELRAMYGKALRGGLLLYGPPGCGKTFIAKAIAGELGATFMSIGLTDVLNMYLGESERNIHMLFEEARGTAPVVLFIDEIDALGRKRSLLRESGGRTVVNQLLTELDSVNSDNDGVFVLAATNHPWDVDSALRRPGRLDRTLLVAPPDSAAREFILRRTMTNRPFEAIDFSRLSSLTPFFSGADCVHLCEAAVESALEDSIRTGTPRPVAMSDFEDALREVKPSTRSWFQSARNYVEFANEGGMFDDLAAYLREMKSR